MIFIISILFLLGAFTVQGAPTTFRTRQSITALSASQISAFKPFTFYASAGYCQPSATLTWSCGGLPPSYMNSANCQVNPGFQPFASGGDGSSTQFWFVGFDPSLKTVIVSHQGTDTSAIIPLLTDGDISMENLDATLFPGVSSSVEAHSGFANEQAKTATTILAAVQNALSTHEATQVTVVGHSLGAAIALLDSVYLPLHLLSGTTVRMIGYGMPRVGNQAFANYIDAHLSVAHINNMEDEVPTLPGIFLGYHHPSGEVHIEDSGEWASCPGQDNPSTQCSTGDVSSIFVGNTADHDGPYDGVEMGC